MRVLLIYPAADFSTFDVARGVQRGLEQEGVEVVPYRLSRRLAHAQHALEALGNPNPDPSEVSLMASEGLPYRAVTKETPWALFVSCLGLHPAGVWALRKMGVKIAGWFTEAPYETDDDRELHFAQFCDVAFVNERTAVGAFQEALDRHGPGRVCTYLPHAYDPDLHKPPAEPMPEADRCDVLFVGTGFPERQHVFECVDWDGIDLRLGGLWPGLSPPHRLHPNLKVGCLPNEETVRAYHAARIVLNPHRGAAYAESANPRVYEAAACGAFQVSDYRTEVAEVFGDSVPLYTPGVPWQLAALIRRYLADEPARRELAEEAQRRVQPHTFRARARQIVDLMIRSDREHAETSATPAAA